ERYRRQCEGLRERGIDPVVTLHHFPTPRWVAARGSWEAPDVVDLFGRYGARLASHHGDVVRTFCTINEPNIVTSIGYGHGAFPPGVRDWDRAARVSETFVAAHRAAVEAVRAAAPGVPVGLTLSMEDYQALPGGEERMARRRRAMEDVYLEGTGGDDF